MNRDQSLPPPTTEFSSSIKKKKKIQIGKGLRVNGSILHQHFSFLWERRGGCWGAASPDLSQIYKTRLGWAAAGTRGKL